MADKNKQSTFADLLSDSELQQTVVPVGERSVTVRELTGRERFELIDQELENHWDKMCWLASKCAIDPELTLEQCDQLSFDILLTLSNAVLVLSGLETDAEEKAENE